MSFQIEVPFEPLQEVYIVKEGPLTLFQDHLYTGKVLGYHFHPATGKVLYIQVGLNVPGGKVERFTPEEIFPSMEDGLQFVISVFQKQIDKAKGILKKEEPPKPSKTPNDILSITVLSPNSAKDCIVSA